MAERNGVAGSYDTMEALVADAESKGICASSATVGPLISQIPLSIPCRL